MRFMNALLRRALSAYFKFFGFENAHALAEASPCLALFLLDL